MKDKIFPFFRLYLLTLVPLIVISVCFAGFWLLDVTGKITYLEFLSDFYVTGSQFDIPAWRWHLLALLISIVAGALEDTRI